MNGLDISFLMIFSIAFQGQMKEYMVRLVYCDMLGYDISFAYIHAVKLAQQGALLEKRVGKSVTERWG